MNHWTEIDFENWLYGLKEPDRHLEECPACRAEMQRLKLERSQVLAEPEVSDDFLAAQRRTIYQRLGEPGLNWVPVRWALSLAALLVVIFSFTLPRQDKSKVQITDEQLFSELSSIEQSAEPKAIEPMHKLFEE